MNRSVVAGVIGAVVIFGAGFGAGFAVKAGSSNPVAAPATRAAGSSASASASQDPAVPTTNVRGAIVKQFGDKAGVGCTGSVCDVDFTIGTPVDATGCSGANPVQNGKIIAMPITVETRAGADLSFASSLWNRNSFSAVLSSGVTLPSLASPAAYGCVESRQEIPSTMAPGSRYEGFIVLDVPADAESIMFLPSVVAGGWEWPLP